MADGPDGAVIEVTLPSRPSFLALARVLVANAATIAPSLRESRVADLRLIVSELYTNAMEANWRGTARRLAEQSDGQAPTHDEVMDAAPPVLLSCRIELDAVEVTIRDSGPGFSPRENPHPPVKDPGRLDFEHGLGIPLVQFLADEVEYSTDAHGTEARALVRDGDRGRSVT